MKEMHWSKPHLNFITIEVTYDDGARQGWDYDCYQYESLEAVKSNMAEDFREPRLDRNTILVHLTTPSSNHTAEISGTELIGLPFMELVFTTIEEMTDGN